MPYFVPHLGKKLPQMVAKGESTKKAPTGTENQHHCKQSRSVSIDFGRALKSAGF